VASLVAIVRCPSYDAAAVATAVAECFRLLGPGAPPLKGNVLLKPNLIFPKPPEVAATTHPAMVRAVAEYLRDKHGATVSVGDSPGGFIRDVRRYWDATGMAAGLGADFPLVQFETGAMVERTVTVAGRPETLRIAKAVVDADAVVSISKLKTHSFTLYTGALKNVFGVIPGLLKANLHTKFRHPFDFARFIAALNTAVKPSLHIMDAVVGMEGEGPSAGTPRNVGLIIASTDPVALDAAAATIIGIPPQDVPTIRFAAALGVGCMDLHEIAFPGLHPRDISIPPFKRPAADTYTRIPRFLYRFLYSFFRTRPVMGPACTACMACSRICPVKAISNRDGKVVVDYKKCIACFCCSEICEFRAVELQASWLAKKLLRDRANRSSSSPSS
jgi:uncharacterized protein (DUF362 family)/Pyruvate/2-oxoacid:ferredoxin oxidoreductase delta subunit